MLANGATLGYKAHGAAGDYTNLPGLKEIPEMGSDPEKVENTCLSDKVKQYDLGIGDAGEMSYKFKYDNSDGSSYRLMRAAEASKQVYDFREKLPDGTTYDYAAQVAVSMVRLSGHSPWDFRARSRSRIRQPDAVYG